MRSAMFSKYETIRTTVTLPASLYRRCQELVDSGQVPNRNTLIVAALEQFVANFEREEIDLQFAAMAEDADYQAFQVEMAESWEIHSRSLVNLEIR